MEIIIGKNAGFCYGVKRAVEGTEKELEKSKKIYCLGELVHNKDVIKKLEEKGLVTINNIESAKGSCIIRAHGEPIETYNKAKDLNINLIDLTCHNVLKNHRLVHEYHENGYYILLLGTKSHPENIGTISYCKGDGECVDLDELDNAINKIKKQNIEKIFVLAQTTYSVSKFHECSKIIEEKLAGKEIKIMNTICNATEIRQKETEELSKKVDCMIIVGGKNSSNTKKLFDISKVNCPNTILVENVEEVNFKELEKCNKVGIMAGASTPSFSYEIKKIKYGGIYEKMLSYDK